MLRTSGSRDLWVNGQGFISVNNHGCDQLQVEVLRGRNRRGSCSSRYYVGVLDKKTKQMEVHNAQLFSLQPVVPGESTAKDETDAHDTKSYRQKVDSLIEAFGTNKQKRALSSRRLNQVGSESLQQAVAQAASNIIQQKGIEVLQQEVADSKAQAEAALYLPPCNPEAEKEADVYPFNQLLSDIEFDALESVGRKMSELSKDELLSMKEKGSPQLVVRHLEFLPSDTPSRDRMSRCVWYLSLLINLAHEKKVNRKFGSKDDCPRIIQNKVMKAFTVESFNNGRVMNMVSSSMKVKLASYCLALLLHMNSMTANLTLLHQDLGLPETRILEVAKAMGLRLNKVVTDVIGRGDQHRLACLELPLAKYDHPGQRNKRRKLH
ncbi:DNA-directed RNA polymerase I subunit RPA49 isoform X2 [Denticeps clupeoides]|uniref:DNA-directed RNA polymerase I subunit RPA49 n=1 Tax=Denticeps clupeoides TaxID=299321 RepID=A0AAY4AMC9_9TELE|nr:DNA-directed RNA polymerase I subunit RPA49 isoform X2 [Denticeps clupeoides]